MKAFFPPPVVPAGMTFRTLNLTVFDRGLLNIQMIDTSATEKIKSAVINS